MDRKTTQKITRLCKLSRRKEKNVERMLTDRKYSTFFSMYTNIYYSAQIYRNLHSNYEYIIGKVL